MNRKTDADARSQAQDGFKRTIGYTFVAAILTVIATLFYLWVSDALTAVSAMVTSIAVFISIMLGAGLMATGFYSSNAGIDEGATGRPRPFDPADQTEI